MYHYSCPLYKVEKLVYLAYALWVVLGGLNYVSGRFKIKVYTKQKTNFCITGVVSATSNMKTVLANINVTANDTL